jgi:hypothetical protein
MVVDTEPPPQPVQAIKVRGNADNLIGMGSYIESNDLLSHFQQKVHLVTRDNKDGNDKLEHWRFRAI